MITISEIINLSLIGVFVLLILFFLIAALRGFARGVWKSTHNMIFMAGLIVASFVTLDALTEFVGSFPLNWIVKGSFYISRTIDGVPITYYVSITSLKDTLTEFVKGFYTLYNISASAKSAVDFAMALTGSILKIIVVIVDIILIVTLGNLLCFLSWTLIFRHLVPRVARKKTKMRWIGLAETAVTFIMVAFMFMMPFTSIVNSVNQAYQRNDVKNKLKNDNEIVENVGNFVNSYNNSIFAKILFNWSVDDQGMTYDTRLFETLTTGVSGEYTINFVREIVNITDLAFSGVGAITIEGNEVVVEIGSLITKEIADKALDTIINSTIIQTVLPIVVDVALNGDLLDDYIPTRLVDLSDVDWQEEIGYIKDMVDCVFDSGVVDNLFITDSEGNHTPRKLEGNDLVAFIESIVYSDNFVDLMDIFKNIDDSRVLSRVVPALVQFAINSDPEGIAPQYLPFTWEELNEFSWGYEMYVLFDFLHSAVELDPDFLKAIFAQTGLYTPENHQKYDLPSLIAANAEDFINLVVGDFNASNEPQNVDGKHGHTIVFNEQGKRIEGRRYCLFDMNLVDRVLPYVLSRLFDLEALQDIRSQLAEEDLELFKQNVAALNEGNRVINYKKEFRAILDVVATLANDTKLIDSLVNGKGLEPLMKEENNFFSIDAIHINYFKQAIGKMNKSSILYSALTPMLKSLLKGDDVANTLNDIGLKSSVLVSAIEQDMKKNNHTLFTDFSSLLDAWSDLNNIYTLTSVSGNTNALTAKLRDDALIASFKNILKLLVNNPLLNPNPQVGDDYEKNENLYGLLEYVFSMTSDLGLTITRETLRTVETSTHTWNDEIDAIGNMLQFIAVHDLMNASSAFSSGFTRTAIDKLVGHSDDDYYIRGLFENVDGSSIFKSTLGPFLDDVFGESLNGFLIDQEQNITFSNVTNWKQEGQNIENLLKSIRGIIPENDADAEHFFDNLDFTTLDKVVDMNAMLHDLAHSNIFTYVDKDNVSHYQFGKWLYNLIDTSMGSFSVDGNPFDLLSDPKFDSDSLVSWNTSKWGVRPEDGANPDPYYSAWKNEYNADGTKPETHYIAYKDFMFINGMDDTNPNVASYWCDYDAFVNKQSAFVGGAYGSEYVAPSSYLANDWGAYFGSDDFITEYQDVFEVDEISRVVKFICYTMRILQPRTDSTKLAFNQMPKELLDNLLLSLNDTSCLRICLYNFYRIATDSIFASSYSGFSLSSAYTTYIIDADLDMFDFEHARSLRSDELMKLTSLYGLLNSAQDNGVLVGDNFVFENVKNGTFLNDLESTLNNINDSYIFHRKGSSKVNQPTTFQGLFEHLLTDSEIGSSIYLGNKSPKDIAHASDYNSVSSKSKYLISNVFPDDAHNPEPNRDSQISEISKLIQTIDKLYSLTDDGGNIVSSIGSADLGDDDNIDAIRDALSILNDSALLRDLVPNSIYKLFIDDPQFSVSYGSQSVDFSRIDPFYHYYYNVDTLAKLTTPNFETAKYSDTDINGFYNLLLEYQTFNDALNGGQITDCGILKLLTGNVDTDGNFISSGALSDLLRTLHDNPIFHSPARNYEYGMYYTDKYQSNGFTLFEEMMAKICSFVGLDDFAFDGAYDSEASASIKLRNRIKAITLADDNLGAGVCYHVTPGTAWHQEIATIMETAYRVADMSGGASVDMASFALNDLDPAKAKTILTSINSSDLIGDAVAKFVKEGLEAINFGTLTTYDAINYANYRIGQVGYGGLDAQSGTGSEIDNIYRILSALRDGDSYITNVSDINAFVTSDTSGERLNGLIRFIYESRILNTPNGQAYQTYNTDTGYSISAQGVLLYNVFNSSGLSGFIARDALTATIETTPLQKIEQLSIITHMPYSDEDAINAGLTYEVESQGLHRLIGVTNDAHIDASVFTGAGNDSINNVKDNYREPILQIIEIAYNANSEGHRSALVSEFVSGLLNNVLENEYNGLSLKTGYAYNQFTFGKPVSDSTIKYSHYETLNVKEKNGLTGILNSLDYASQLNISALLSMSDEERHALADNLESAFSLMTTNSENSEIARIVYLNDFHIILKPIAAIPNKDLQDFTASLVDESSLSTANDSRTVYSGNFSFSNYGTALKNYIYPGFY